MLVLRPLSQVIGVATTLTSKLSNNSSDPPKGAQQALAEALTTHRIVTKLTTRQACLSGIARNPQISFGVVFLFYVFSGPASDRVKILRRGHRRRTLYPSALELPSSHFSPHPGLTTTPEVDIPSFGATSYCKVQHSCCLTTSSHIPTLAMCMSYGLAQRGCIFCK